MLGEAVQHVEYSAFGETFFEERNSAEATPYLYNAKERDTETGLYYYGARYYNPMTSQWMSVDPKASSYPNLSPYCFVVNNPVAFTDPDGREVEIETVTHESGKYRTEYIFHIRGVFINRSNKDLSQYQKENIAQQIKDGIEYHLTGSSIFLRAKWSARVEMRVADEGEYRPNNGEHAYMLDNREDMNGLNNAGLAPVGDFVNPFVRLSERHLDDDTYSIGFTAAHETIHTMQKDKYADEKSSHHRSLFSIMRAGQSKKKFIQKHAKMRAKQIKQIKLNEFNKKEFHHLF